MTKQSLDIVSGRHGGRRVPTRRALVKALPAVGLAAVFGPRWGVASDGVTTAPPTDEPVPQSFPRQSEDEVREIVRVSHFDLDQVIELVAARPALARASWDWGFGDWESAIGAASHTGRREIAEVLLDHGARPTLFTAAMLGWLEVVQAAVAARPGIQSETGPHSITLLAHAQAGGQQAEAMVGWLIELGGADPKPAVFDADPAPYLGTYRFGNGETDVIDVHLDRRKNLAIQRLQQDGRVLIPVGENRFYPSGVPSVRIQFEIAGDVASAVTVYDGRLRVRATRSSAG